MKYESYCQTFGEQEEIVFSVVKSTIYAHIELKYRNKSVVVGHALASSVFPGKVESLLLPPLLIAAPLCK